MVYVKDNKRYTVNQLRRMGITSPLNSGFEKLRDIRPTYDNSKYKLVDKGTENNSIVWETVELTENEKMIYLDVLTTRYEDAIQNHLDSVARETKWDNMQSARACAGITLIGTETDIEKAIHDDAVTLSRWYLKVWAYCYQELDKIKAGTREIPTVEAFIAELPTK